MKTILLSTDLSASARHAAEYGYRLAELLKANVVICNAVIVPAEMPEAGMIAWPAEEYDMLMESSKEGLKQLKKKFETNQVRDFRPLITCVSEDGILSDVINEIVAKQKIDLIVMATHGNTGLGGFLLGNHCRNMINGTNIPLLLVPPSASVREVKKIAFATDFTQPMEDLDFIYSLIPLAKVLNAEILLTHVCDEVDTANLFQKQIKPFLTALSNKADYPDIFYRIVKNNKTEAGLDWLCRHGQVDMLAMVHRPRNFLDGLLKGSHTNKMANHTSVPLLVFPGHNI